MIVADDIPIIKHKTRPQMHMYAELPKPGTEAPAFTLQKPAEDYSFVTRESFNGKTIILHTFPTTEATGPDCLTTIRKFNDLAASLPKDKVVVLAVLNESPFALRKWVDSLPNVTLLSASGNFPDDKHFGLQYGVRIMDGFITGAFARAVVVIDENGMVLHSEYSKMLSDPPNYDACISAALKKQWSENSHKKEELDNGKGISMNTAAVITPSAAPSLTSASTNTAVTFTPAGTAAATATPITITDALAGTAASTAAPAQVVKKDNFEVLPSGAVKVRDDKNVFILLGPPNS